MTEEEKPKLEMIDLSEKKEISSLLNESEQRQSSLLSEEVVEEVAKESVANQEEEKLEELPEVKPEEKVEEKVEEKKPELSEDDMDAKMKAYYVEELKKANLQDKDLEDKMI